MVKNMKKLTKKQLKDILIIYKNNFYKTFDIIIYKKDKKWKIEIIFEGCSAAPAQFSIKNIIDDTFDNYNVINYSYKNLTNSNDFSYLYENILEKIEEFEKKEA